MHAMPKVLTRSGIIGLKVDRRRGRACNGLDVIEAVVAPEVRVTRVDLDTKANMRVVVADLHEDRTHEPTRTASILAR